MSRYTRRPLKVYVPAKTNGNLYYLRLRTDLGILYKLGFTSLNSAEERIAFNGKGDELKIDKVLFFHYFEDGFEKEQLLHNHFKSAFGKFSSKEYMPLAKNGQSELYVNDILGLDGNFTEEQAVETLSAISKVYSKQRGTELQDEILGKVGKVLAAVCLPLFKSLFWLVGNLMRFFIKPSFAQTEANERNGRERKTDEDNVKAVIYEINYIVNEKKDEILLQKAARIREKMKERGL